ncbi:MAG TPA: DUF6286 domain-containing protein [Mycobacteriales bacterium]|jgi:hypothetical protein|nr:DUF6286 domain-containing protein [Mycobacteriales bacterium]
MRYVNRASVVLLTLALAAGGVLTAIEVGLATLGRPPLLFPREHVADLLRRSQWADAPVAAALLGVAVLGLALLVGQLVPRRTRLLSIADPTPGVTAATTRRSLERALRRAATAADGITAASVTARPRRVKVRAVTGLRDVTGIHANLVAAVDEQLDGIGLARRPALSVSLRQKEPR